MKEEQIEEQADKPANPFKPGKRNKTGKDGQYLNRSEAFLLELLQVYKSLPCLYAVNSPDYSDREKRSEAYGILLEKYNEEFPEATLSDLKSKINILRTNYRRERNRVHDALQNKRVITPNLYYYDSIKFVDEFEYLPPFPKKKMGKVPPTIKESDQSSSIPEPPSYHSAKRTRMEPDTNGVAKTNDGYERVAKYWANEIQKMSSEQQIHAKKIINDILYEGQLGNLYKDCVIIQPRQQETEDSYFEEKYSVTE